jgi:hypothetical protein
MSLIYCLVKNNGKIIASEEDDKVNYHIRHSALKGNWNLVVDLQDVIIYHCQDTDYFIINDCGLSTIYELKGYK